MNCQNCNAKLEAGTELCPLCGMEVEIKKKRHRNKKTRIISAVTAGVTLALVILLVFIFIRDTTISSQVGITNTPPNLFYLKENAVYYTSIDKIQPKKVIPYFTVDKTALAPIYQTALAPIFLSDDGKWLFYPQGNRNNADVFTYPLSSEQENGKKIASGVDIFTANKDASKMFYLSKHQLYAGNMSEFNKIDTNVDHYFSNNECSWVVYIKTNGTLYEKRGDKAAKKLVDNVDLRFVSLDLKTIYYLQDETLYLLKDGKDIVKVHDGNPRILYVYENGDIYYKSGSSLTYSLDGAPKRWDLYYFSDGESKQISNNSTYVNANGDNTYLYPFRLYYGGTNTPLIMFDDTNNNHFICKGSEVLKEITGGFIGSALFSSSGNGLYYVALNKQMDFEGDLYYASIKGSSVSDSKKIAFGVSAFNNHYKGDNFVYYKNVDYSGYDAYGIGDMYINEEKIDSGVRLITWLNNSINPNAFIYHKNTKQYFNESDQTYYTNDTLMFYQDGETKKIADNVIDYSIYGDQIVYLSIADPDAKSGTLHLYDVSGEDIIIDTEVNAIIRPKTDRQQDGEINPAFRVPYFYLQDEG